jgi:lysophospholipase L1-like esterase
MKTKHKHWLANLVLLVISLLICGIIGEVSVRVFHLLPSQRSLLFSQAAFQMGEYECVKYVSNEDIRTVAVYDQEIAYDVRFHTNNLGLIDDQDYFRPDSAGEKRHFAFVGDSFTAGFHGGQPWVPGLRAHLPSDLAEVYNLGVSGAGFEHFYRLLKNVGQTIPFTDIFILGISNDFGRMFWYPASDSVGIYFCMENTPASECMQNNYVIRMIPEEASKEELLENARKNYAEREAINNAGRPLKKLFKRSQFITFLVFSIRQLSAPAVSPVELNYPYSLEALRKIKEDYPAANIHFIHLPQKSEVIQGHYSLEHIKGDIEKLGISYFPALEKGNWDKSMFFESDSHPNKKGYAQITNAVLDYLRSNALSSSSKKGKN